MKVFLDSCIFFKCLDDHYYKRTVKHLQNDGHELITSITVAGEILSVCFKKDDISKLKQIIDFWTDINCQIAHPPQLPEDERHSQLRICCMCLDNAFVEEKRYGSSLTDRTHLAYAIVYDCDYFFTTGREPSALKKPRGCGHNIKVVDNDMLRRELNW